MELPPDFEDVRFFAAVNPADEFGDDEMTIPNQQEETNDNVDVDVEKD